MLKPCPCGQVPDNLSVHHPGSKWSSVSGDCCGEWFIEAKIWYAEDNEAEKIAIEFWNNTPRGRKHSEMQSTRKSRK